MDLLLRLWGKNEPKKGTGSDEGTVKGGSRESYLADMFLGKETKNPGLGSVNSIKYTIRWERDFEETSKIIEVSDFRTESTEFFFYPEPIDFQGVSHELIVKNV